MMIAHGLRTALPTLALLLSLPSLLSAQQISFAPDSVLSARARGVVDEFLRVASREKLTEQHLARLTTGDFMKTMTPMVDTAPFSADYIYRATSVLGLVDSSLAVAVSAVGDTVPRFGPLTIEMVLFLVSNDVGELRIAQLRRYSALEETVRFAEYVDTSADFPRSLKGEIVRERTGALMSNQQLRAHLVENRVRFQALAKQFAGRDSLRVLGRNDLSVTQLNRTGIDWGAAAESIPQEAIDEYLASATPKQRIEMQQHLKKIEGMRKAGRDSLTRYARRYRIPLQKIDSTIALMKELRISFVNGALPWKSTIQFTVGGTFTDAVGFLYAPKGGLPLLSPDEYYYLEEVGDGWWIFRAT
jgi:hypothetical protein